MAFREEATLSHPKVSSAGDCFTCDNQWSGGTPVKPLETETLWGKISSFCKKRQYGRISSNGQAKFFSGRLVNNCWRYHCLSNYRIKPPVAHLLRLWSHFNWDGTTLRVHPGNIIAADDDVVTLGITNEHPLEWKSQRDSTILWAVVRRSSAVLNGSLKKVWHPGRECRFPQKWSDSKKARRSSINATALPSECRFRKECGHYPKFFLHRSAGRPF